MRAGQLQQLLAQLIQQLPRHASLHSAAAPTAVSCRSVAKQLLVGVDAAAGDSRVSRACPVTKLCPRGQRVGLLSAKLRVSVVDGEQRRYLSKMVGRIVLLGFLLLLLLLQGF